MSGDDRKATKVPPAERPGDDSVLLDALIAPLAEALQQASLPLHILLESRFGELNDNQLEMIEAARESMDAADQLLRRARRIRERSPDAVAAGLAGAGHRPLDLLYAPVALASARGAGRGVTIDVDASPALPRVIGDRAHLEELLSLVLAGCVAQASAGQVIRVRAEHLEQRVAIEIRHGETGPPPLVALDALLAQRLVTAEGGELREDRGGMHIALCTALPLR